MLYSRRKSETCTKAGSEQEGTVESTQHNIHEITCSGQLKECSSKVVIVLARRESEQYIGHRGNNTLMGCRTLSQMIDVNLTCKHEQSSCIGEPTHQCAGSRDTGAFDRLRSNCNSSSFQMSRSHGQLGFGCCSLVDPQVAIPEPLL